MFELDGSVIEIVFTGFRDGTVYHYSSTELGQALVGRPAVQRIDLHQRLANSRLHAAGHLVAHVLETMDDSLVPAKGHHFPDGSYVELANPAERSVTDWLDAINVELATAIAADKPIIATLTNYATIVALRPSLASFTPKDKPSRIVQIGDYKALPCGGTHPASLRELGMVRVTKAKTKSGTTKISYEVSDY